MAAGAWLTSTEVDMTLHTTADNAEKAPEEERPLSVAQTGELFEVVRLEDGHARVQALRFGIAEGACVECIARVPAGPIVVRSGRQEIAIGRGLAERIRVRRRRGRGGR